jgi:hypothetical protein
MVIVGKLDGMIGTPELMLFVGVFALLPLVLGILVAVDASRFPDHAFEAVATSKTLWIVLPLVGIVACGIVTIVAAIVWYASYKPKVLAASQGGAAAS